MAFINKKEEVIKLRLTQHGKHLLSVGKFKPDSYALFDDDIIYDTRYAGVTEHQNDSQDRIKNQIRRDAQHLCIPVNKRESLEGSDEDHGIMQEPDFLSFYPTDIENEKILGFPLTNMDLGEQEAPRFELNLKESEIENTKVEYDLMDGSRIRIPQLTVLPKHILIRDTMNVDPYSSDEDPGTLVDSESYIVDVMAEKIEFLDGSFFEHQPEKISFSLEEFNTPYLKENFELEVFEIINSGEENERLIPIKNYSNLFEISGGSYSQTQQTMQQVMQQSSGYTT